jgi:two-component system, NarL family, invasion response regulator UvrY
MNQEPIKVVIVDDHRMVRETWKMILDKHDRIRVIAECGSGEEAIRAAANLKPDVMLMDINMSPVNGLEATKEIMKLNPEAKIIGVSVNDQPMYAKNMMQLGAKGYMTKNSSMSEMVQAIIEVNDGNTYLCQEIREKIYQN